MLDGLDVNIDSAPSLSPDGERMLYRASGRLFVRALSEFAPKPLPGSEGANYFFWSPDGRQVAFVRDGKIWRVGVDSSEATQVGAVPRDLSGTGGGVWTVGGELVLAGSDGFGLFAVPLNGAAGREILPLDRKQETDFHDVTSCRMGAGCSSPSIDCRDPTPSRSLPTASGRMSSGSRGNLFDRRSIRPRGTSSTRVREQILASGRCDSRCHASPQRASRSSSPLAA